MQESSSDFVRWSGLAAILGGVLWIIGAVIHASRPRGCIAEECALRPMRESGAAEGILTLLALLCFVAGLAGLLVLIRSAGRFGGMEKTGITLGAVGNVLLVIASAVEYVFLSGDSSIMPLLVIPGIFALVIGLVVLGVGILRSGVLPRWVAVLLIVGALAMLGSNDQTALELLLVPLGISWIVVGYALWSGNKASVEQAARVR